jgi:hypothetical protein
MILCSHIHQQFTIAIKSVVSPKKCLSCYSICASSKEQRYSWSTKQEVVASKPPRTMKEIGIEDLPLHLSNKETVGRSTDLFGQLYTEIT